MRGVYTERLNKMVAFAQRSFSGGEISPSLYPRVDQAKYASSLKTARNFAIARNGGAFNRPGTGFVAEVKDSNRTVRLIPFVFSNDQTYVMEFGHNYIRFYDDGGQVLEAEKTITGATQADPCVVTSNSHGFLDGEEVYISGVVGMTQLNGRNFKVTGVTTNTFNLVYMDGTNVNSNAFTAYSSGGTVARVYTVTTPYNEEHLQDIQFVQSADVVTLVHQSYAPRNLSRTSITNWALAEITLAPSLSAPTFTVSGGAGTASVYVLTALKQDSYEESLASAEVGSAVTASSGTPVTITITVSTTGAIEYNVYKKTNGIYGYIGTMAAPAATTFVDNGIAADALDTPPTQGSITTAFSYTYTKQSDPATLPAGTGNCAAWSPDGQFLAIAHATSPFITIYQLSGTTLTKLADPATLPAGTGNWCAWTPDSAYLVVAHATSPFVTVYKVSGTTFTKIADPGTLPTGIGNGCACLGPFSENGKYDIAVAHDTTPFVTIYTLDPATDTFSKYTNPSTLPAGNANAVHGHAWGTDRIFSVSHATTPFVSDYLSEYPGAVYTKLPSPASLPAGTGNGVSFSPDGYYLSVAHTTSPFVTIYSVNQASYALTKLSDPASLPAGTGQDVSWSSDGQLMFVAHTTTPFVTMYRRDGTTFTKMTDPATLPDGNGNGVASSSDDGLLAVVHATSQFITIYGRSFSAPGAVTYHQQRLCYANTGALPETAWCSRTGAYKNFTLATPVSDDSAIIFTVAGRQVNRIKHMLSLNRLVLLTEAGEHTADGDAAGMLTPTAINLRQHSYNGSGSLSPLVVGGHAIYVQARGTKVRDLVFDQNVEGLRGTDLTIFSSHLFDGYTLRDWAYQQEPNSTVWAVRSDGTLLGCTIVREQEILAWHRHDFDGTVEQVCCVPEGNEDAVYLIIKRTINSVTKRYIERMKTRQISDISDSVFVDCSLSYDGRNTTATTMTLSGGTTWAYDETLTLTASSAFFSSSDVGNEIQLTGSDGTVIRFRIYGYTSTTIVTGRPHATVPVVMRSVAITTWTKAVDDLTNLWHLEGKAISVVGDGFVVASPNNSAYATLTVTNGAVTLPRPYGVIHAGLPYISDLQTLSIDTAQGETVMDKKKLIGKVVLSVQQTRGLWVGSKPPSDDAVNPLEGLREQQAHDDTNYDVPVDLVTDVVDLNIQTDWDSSGSIFVRQVDPIPATILAAVPVGLVPIR